MNPGAPLDPAAPVGPRTLEAFPLSPGGPGIPGRPCGPSIPGTPSNPRGPAHQLMSTTSILYQTPAIHNSSPAVPVSLTLASSAYLLYIFCLYCIPISSLYLDLMLSLHRYISARYLPLRERLGLPAVRVFQSCPFFRLCHCSKFFKVSALVSSLYKITIAWTDEISTWSLQHR